MQFLKARQRPYFQILLLTMAFGIPHSIVEKKMKFINRYDLIVTFLGVALVLFFSGCVQRDNVTEPAQIDTPTQSNPITTPTPNTTVAMQTTESIVSSGNYLTDCELKYPLDEDANQVGFLNIYPGITTEAELINQLGQTYRFSNVNEQKEYFYSDQDATYAYSFLVTDKVVKDIAVLANDEILSSLQSILEKYGCPDLIIAQALSDDPFDNSLIYNKTIFRYLNMGIWMRFEAYPIAYSDTPSVLGFQKPISLDSFLETIFDIKTSKIASFSEAIK